MDAPVVVNPLTVSKKASMGLGMAPLMTKGAAPMMEYTTHVSAVITKPSRA